MFYQSGRWVMAECRQKVKPDLNDRCFVTRETNEGRIEGAQKARQDFWRIVAAIDADEDEGDLIGGFSQRCLDVLEIRYRHWTHIGAVGIAKKYQGSASTQISQMQGLSRLVGQRKILEETWWINDSPYR